jgi:hypothetical protein
LGRITHALKNNYGFIIGKYMSNELVRSRVSNTSYRHQTSSDKKTTSSDKKTEFVRDIEAMNEVVIETLLNEEQFQAWTVKSPRVGTQTPFVPLRKEFEFIVYPNIEPVRLDDFVPLQKWEGFVIDVMEDTFTVRLSDLTRNNAEEVAEIPKEEVSEEDRVLIKAGALFYWNIGYLDRPSGRQRSSMIRFRRLPIWGKEELEKARQHTSWEKRNFPNVITP